MIPTWLWDAQKRTNGPDGEREAEPGELAALFDVLSHETRIEIVAALYEADAPVGYAQLKAEIGIRDNGKFNYHLRTLSEDLLRRTDDGYALTDTGTTFFERTVASEPR